MWSVAISVKSGLGRNDEPCELYGGYTGWVSKKTPVFKFFNAVIRKIMISRPRWKDQLEKNLSVIMADISNCRQTEKKGKNGRLRASLSLV